MRLLILTQKVDKNDSNLGFFHEWIKRFAKEVEQIIVICLEAGERDLPENVEVLSLGKEKKRSKLQYVKSFYRYIRRERENYDVVLVHMNPEYIVLGGILWMLWGKKIALWYTHKSVTLKLRVATFLVDNIFTASKKSFRLKSRKVHVVGHGINLDQFECKTESSHKVRRILTAGRISESKNLETLVDAAVLLRDELGEDFEIDIVGDPITHTDEEYLFLLKLSVGREDLEKQIHFRGAVKYEDMPSYYRKADVFINLSDTGSIDKAVLEAMASCLPVVSSNEAFKKILVKYELFTDADNPTAVAETIKRAADFKKTDELREYVEEYHSLEILIPNIIKTLES